MSEPVRFDISDEAAMAVAQDPVIQHLMKNVDRAAIRENLKLTPEQRLLKLERRVEELETQNKTPGEPLQLKEVPPRPYFTEPGPPDVWAHLGEARPDWMPFDPVIE